MIREIRKSGITSHLTVIGSHASALPREILKEENVNSIIIGEGVYALQNLCMHNDLADLSNVKGIAWRDGENNIIVNDPEIIIPQEKMD